MVASWLKNKAVAARGRGIFRRTAAPRKCDACFLQQLKSARIKRIAGISETCGAGDAMFLAAGVDRLELLGDLGEVFGADTHVVAGMVADLKAVAVQLCDLFPGHVIIFVGLKSEPLRDEERGSKTVILQNRPHNCEMR